MSKDSIDQNRRVLLTGMAKTAALSSAALASASIASVTTSKSVKLKGNVNHSVSRWTYGDLSIDELCQVVKTLGFNAIDLVGPSDWHTLKRYGVDSSMCNGAELNLEDGFIHPEYHYQLVARYLAHIDLVADAGYTNLICFSGNARGLSKQQGLRNAVAGLQRILPHAQKRGVTIFMELFNSKIDHPDYMADTSAWGVELCQALNSPNFSLLYDIYHMQISEGDLIRTITDNHQYFGHYHTAGVPGRNEIGDTQEIYYPAVVDAIKATGFNGSVAQEFVPTHATQEGRIASLAQAVQICDR